MRWTSSRTPTSRLPMLLFFIVMVGDVVDGSVGRSFVKSPQSIITPPGDNVNFECETDPPADRYTWLRNGEPLENGTDTKILEGSLTIKFGVHFLEYDKQRGEYQCVAWFGSSGLASVAAALELAELVPFPNRIGPESKLAVIEGNTAVIKCLAPYSKPPATITFSREGTRVVPDGERVLVTDSGNLLVYDVRTNDSGAYICSVQNHITNQLLTANVNTTLRVVSTNMRTAAAFKVRPPPRNPVVRGANLTLECVAVGNPPPTVTWKRRGGKLDPTRHVMMRSNLKLVNVQRNDEGSYVCEAENGRGEMAEAVTVVEVEEPPNIIDGPKDSSALEGSESVMTCSVKGRPSPSIEWLFNGRRVKDVPGVRASGNKAVINRVKKDHAGIFQCFAKNPHGVDTASAFLYVQPKSVSAGRNDGGDPGDVPSGQRDKTRKGGNKKKWKKRPAEGKRPSSGPYVTLDAMEPPSRPNVTRLADDSVMLTWEMPQSTAALPIQFFKIQYRAMRRRAQWRTLDEEIPPHIRSCAVPNLETGQRYKFRILAAYANNDHSVGPTSKKFLLQADDSDDRPTLAPKILETEPEGTDGLVVKWDYVESKAKIEGFFIYYRSTTSAGDYQQVNVLGAGVRSHVLRHLEPATTYDVKIQAFNIGGTSSFSNLITAKTREIEGSKDSSVPDGRRDEINSVFSFGGNSNSAAEVFGLPTEFPLYLIIVAVIGALAVLLVVPCVVCYLRRRFRTGRGTIEGNEGGKFQDTSLRLRQEAALRVSASDLRRPNGASLAGTPNGMRPMSTVGFPTTPTSQLMPPLGSNAVSASCDRFLHTRHSMTMDPPDRFNGRQETSFIYPPRGSTLPYPVRQTSCSTFQPSGSIRSSSNLNSSGASTAAATATLGRGSISSFKRDPETRSGRGEEEDSLVTSTANESNANIRNRSPRRRDWRVVDSSPSELEASWASQQLLSPPTVDAGGGYEDLDEPSTSPTGYDSQGSGGTGSVVLRRPGGADGERRPSNALRPTSWKNDRRRSKKIIH